MPAETIFLKFLESGVLGALLLVAGWWIWVKDRAAITAQKEWNAERVELNRQIGEEKDARVEDAKGYAQMSLALQSRVLDAARKLRIAGDHGDSRRVESEDGSEDEPPSVRAPKPAKSTTRY